MMNGRGKSDSSVVPEKPPNKTEEPAAEVVEGRGLAKGNPPRRNALRTQSRASAHSALERVRQVARRDRRQRFTALLHHVYKIDCLHRAYLAVKRDAAAGVDGETWQHYGEDLERNLLDPYCTETGSSDILRDVSALRPLRRTVFNRRPD